MKRVIIESPYAGDVRRNLRYVRAAMRHSLLRGEAPFPSHALYTQPGVLDDNIPDERKLGIDAGFAWREAAHLTAVYKDLGTSGGMTLGIDHAAKTFVPVEARALGPAWDTGEHDADVREECARIAEADASSTGRVIAERIRRGVAP